MKQFLLYAEASADAVYHTEIYRNYIADCVQSLAGGGESPRYYDLVHPETGKTTRDTRTAEEIIADVVSRAKA